MNLLALTILAGVSNLQPQPEPALPVEPLERVLLDRTLAQRPVRLLAINAQSVQVVDAVGSTQSLPLSEVLAILPTLAALDAPIVTDAAPTLPQRNRFLPREQQQAPPPPVVTGRLELTDGQILPGMLTSAPSANPEILHWNSTLWGPIEVPLDSVSGVAINAERFDALAPDKSTRDVVLLRNGDKVEGFLESLGQSVKVEQGGKITEIPLARVDGVRLANPIKPEGGPWVWLNNTAATISSVTLGSNGDASISGRIAGVKSQPSAGVSAALITAICFDRGIVHPLAQMPMTVSPAPGDADRRWTPPPTITGLNGPIGGADIELAGPMRVEWALPKNTSRVTATLELPPSARLWGDCVVVVESVGASNNAVPVATQQLNQSQPQIVVNAALSGASRLRITIDPGPSGPIQDRVVIRRALVLAAPR